MQLLYNSDSFAVVRFGNEEPSADASSNDGTPTAQGKAGNLSGFEIVDKVARKEIFLQGLVAQSFQRGVKALVEQGPDEEALEDFIASFTVLAQQPLILH